MTILLNGAERQLAAVTTLYACLLQHAPPPEMTYVRQNGAYVSRQDYQTVTLREGDRLTVYRVPSGG